MGWRCAGQVDFCCKLDEMTAELEYEIVYSKATTDFIEALLVDTEYDSSDRVRLALAYAALNLEHQSAIRVLVEQHHRGSAYALVRSQVEACFRGLWVQRLASNDQVKSIKDHGAEPFPRYFRDMAEALDGALETERLFQGIAGSWKALNGFTHSGLEQLSRRFNGSGDLAPNYSDADTRKLLRASASTALLMFPPLFRIYGMGAKAEAIEAWLIEKGNDPGPQPVSASHPEE